LPSLMLNLLEDEEMSSDDINALKAAIHKLENQQ